ncbi:MAG: hypothetical protein MRY51_06630 [Flavobacteriaceae bacterium]|nr:hypothetical protein [Flavobacteriaceae bacterium]MCI5088635.1 hypothetical protein [Flavobacteriaceae bacterium]
MRNLENFGVQEMSIVEQKNVDGGWFFLPAVGVAIVNEVVSDWKNFKAGLFGRPPINN